MKVLACLALICTAARGSVELVSDGPGGCTLLFETGPTAAATTDPDHLFDGMGILFEPGRPMLPVQRVYVPVPPGSEPVLEYAVLARSSDLSLAREARRAPALEGSGLSTVEVEAPPLPGPSRNVELAGVIPLAGFSFAAIDIYPWLGGADGSYASSVRLDLSWDGSRARPSRPTRLARLVCGFDLPFYRLESSRADSPFWGLPWARIEISETGGYEVTCSGLAGAGCDVEGAQSASLAMFSGPGEMFGFDPAEEHSLSPVAIQVLDGGDGIFDGGDRIRFVGIALSRWVPYASGAAWVPHRWDATNTYWLTWGGEPGRRMETLPAVPDGSPQYGDYTVETLVEQESQWDPEHSQTTGWVWTTISPGDGFDAPYTLDCEPAGVGELNVRLCAPDIQAVHYMIYLDGDLIAEGSWSGGGVETVTVSGIAIPGNGTVRVENTTSEDHDLFLDWVRISAPAAPGQTAGMMLMPGIERQGRFTLSTGPFDSSSSLYLLEDSMPTAALSGFEIQGSAASFSLQVSVDSRILAVGGSDWLSPDSIAPADPGRLVGTVTGADILIVTPESLADELWGLLSFYSSMGLECEVATTREIYDEFGQGVADPGAVRSAVRWAMDSWTEPPSGVLLVGDGHHDPLGHTTSVPSLIFPWSSLGYNDTLVDDRYVMAHEDADLPELPIARLPVQTGAELLTCTAKLLAQSSGENQGAWTNRMLFIADDEWGEGDNYDELYHTNDTERLAEEMAPRRIERVKFYLIEYPWPPSGTHPKKPEAREDLLALLSEGFGAVCYLGHGAAEQIAHEGAMYGSDVSLLENGGRLPVSFWATCDVGHFDGTGDDAIAERLLLHPAGGGLASVAATRGCSGPSNYSLCRAVFDSLFTHPDLTVAEALWQCKVDQSGSYYINNRGYVLFGDLTTRLPRPDGEAGFTVEGDTLRTGETNHVSGTCRQGAGSVFVTVMESSSPVTYICRMGSEIEYMKYGGAAFRGSAPVTAGTFGLDCILPVQSVDGPYGRAGGSVPAPSDVDAGGADPVPVAQGTPAGGDYEGPEAEMWIAGQEGVAHPEVSGGATLRASISDPSGICFLGGPGRQLTLFVDATGSDVGDYFSYLQGSTTEGLLECGTGSLSVGEHRLILWSFDGVGNGSSDTLLVSVREEGSVSISEALVYPNPGNGLRCFSFRLSEDAAVRVSIHTIAGRCIRTIDAQCSQGYNQILWDGMDADGDEPATGAYVYFIGAVTTGTSSFESETGLSGVLAVVR